MTDEIRVGDTFEATLTVTKKHGNDWWFSELRAGELRIPDVQCGGRMLRSATRISRKVVKVGDKVRIRDFGELTAGPATVFGIHGKNAAVGWRNGDARLVPLSRLDSASD